VGVVVICPLFADEGPGVEVLRSLGAADLARGVLGTELDCIGA
jgi:hypothetical protein